MSVPTVNLTFPEHHHKIVKSSTFSGGLFINNEFVAGSDGKTFETTNPSTGKVIASVSEASAKDVDRAVDAAQAAYDSVWGLKVPGHARGALLRKLADLIVEHADEIASIESLDNGKSYNFARNFDVSEAANCLYYYSGWSDKVHGKVMEVDDSKLAFTRMEPLGVVGQIIPWNFPILMFAWKIAPALACGNTIVLKTAEQTPLSALFVCSLIAKVFPPGVVNVISGFGAIAGAAIASHMKIEKVAFTGSTLVGRAIMAAAAKSNLKNVTLELGGKSANIVFDDADLEQAVSWSTFGFSFNHGQTCCAGTRIFVQEGIYDTFLAKLTAKVASLKVGDPFAAETYQGPQTSQIQYDRIMAHVQSGVDEGATVHCGGKRVGTEGYFIAPTVFTNVTSEMRIVREEIFGPVVVITKFKDEADIIAKANDSVYGLAASVFSRDVSRAITTANKLQAGTVWVNNYNQLHSQVPFGGFKQSGIGRELGEYALANYTAVKSVIVNLTGANPL